jgi:hypothetical protein
MPEPTPEPAEKEKFYEFFQIDVPPSIEPKGATVTMVTPRESDIVIYSNPENKDDKDPRQRLTKGQPIAARLRDQTDGDVISYNVQGKQKGSFGTMESRLVAFKFSASNGWQPLKGGLAFTVGH